MKRYRDAAIVVAFTAGLIVLTILWARWVVAAAFS